MQNPNFKDNVNDIRTNIIEVILRLFQKLNASDREIKLYHERYELHYVPKRGLWLKGCSGKVFTKDERYASISLGYEIQNYEHVPFEWLNSLLTSEICCEK